MKLRIKSIIFFAALLCFTIKAHSFTIIKPVLLCGDLFQSRSAALAEHVEIANLQRDIRLFEDSVSDVGQKHLTSESETREIILEIIESLRSAAFEGRWSSRVVHKGLIEKRTDELIKKLDKLYIPTHVSKLKGTQRFWNDRARYSALALGAIRYAELQGFKVAEHWSFRSVAEIRMTIWHDIMKPIGRLILLSNPAPYRTLTEEQITHILVHGTHGLSKYTQAQFFRMWGFVGRVMPWLVGTSLSFGVVLGVTFASGMVYRTAISTEAEKVADAVTRALELKSLQKALMANRGLSVYYRAIENYRKDHGVEPPANWITETQAKMRILYPDIKFEN